MSDSIRPLVALALALGCSQKMPPTPPPPLPQGDLFIAFERHFQGFEGWTEIALPDRQAQGITHVAGKRRAFISHLPAQQSAVFPVGTMIVKQIVEGAEKGHDLFAMVKRGGGYNSRGATGWEWFELRRREDDSIGIVWRGINAPDGEGYGGDPLGGCNGCHEIARKNDWVRSKGLSLRP